MQTAYRFKIQPHREQKAMLLDWQHKIGSLYNLCLRDRIDSYYQTKILGNYCDLKTQASACPLTCSVNKSASLGNPWKTENPSRRRSNKKFNPRRTAYEIHSSLATEWRQTKPWYSTVSSDVLQQSLRHLDKAFIGFFKQGRGFPQFKRHYDVGIEFKPKTVRITGNRITCPVLGQMKFFLSREIPETWEVRTVTLGKEVDGWYASILLRDEAVPDFPVKTEHEIKTCVGVDVGIKKLVSLSNGELIANPRFDKQSERRLRIRQRRLNRKKKGSNNRKKTANRVAKVHQKIRRQRQDYQWKVAKQIAESADLIVFEDLNVKGMKARCRPKWNEEKQRYLRNNQSAKSQLNQGISDASWYSLKLKTKHQANKLGRWVADINPRKTSQECSQCGHVSPKNRDGEKFVCESCGHHEDADIDAAIVIGNRGIKLLKLGSTKLLVVSQKVTPKPELTGSRKGNKSLLLGGESGNPKQVKSVQLSLFDLLEWNSG
jgi:putative transposase